MIIGVKVKVLQYTLAEVLKCYLHSCKSREDKRYIHKYHVYAYLSRYFEEIYFNIIEGTGIII